MANTFIAIAGNMGVGKSTLTQKLASRLSCVPYLEPTTENPYLSDFYTDMDRWGFHSQIFFLSHRLQQHFELSRSHNAVIQDRSVYENAEVFARNLYERGILSPRDFETYTRMYHTLIELLPPPHLIIYLRASVPVLTERIRARGRDFETTINETYLHELNRLYEKWATETKVAPVLSIDTDHINFSLDNKAVDTLAENIKTMLHLTQLPLVV